MDALFKILNQTLWQVLGKVITSFSTIFILGVIARNYQETGTGIFTLALTYLTMFNLLVDFGFNAHVLKKLKAEDLRYKLKWHKLLGTRLVWSVALTILAIGLLPFWSFTTSDFQKAAVFGSLSVVGFSVYITCNLIFQSKLRYDFSILSSSLGAIVSLVLVVFLSSQNYPIFILLTANSASWLIIAAVSLILVRRYVTTLSPIFNFQYVVNLFKESWPIAATLFLNVVYFRADSFLIAYFKGISDVGVYNLAYSVFQSVLVLPAFIMNAYYPLMLKSFKAVKSVGFALLLLAILGSLVTLSFGPQVIKLITDKGFLGSSESLRILSFGFPAYFLSSLLMWALVARGKYKSMLTIYFLGLLFNLTLNFVYIPKYSYIAASWVTVISEYWILFLQIMVLWLNKKRWN